MAPKNPDARTGDARRVIDPVTEEMRAQNESQQDCHAHLDYVERVNVILCWALGAVPHASGAADRVRVSCFTMTEGDQVAAHVYISHPACDANDHRVRHADHWRDALDAIVTAVLEDEP